MTWPPEDALELVYDFFVVGSPATAGSKVSFPVMNKKTGKPVLRQDGRPVIATKDSSGDKGIDWRSAVGNTALAERSTDDPFAEEKGLLHGPLAVELTFYRQRPKGHYGTGRNAGILKASAPAYPTTRPDGLKLGRAVEDALTSVLWTDDSISVDLRARKRWGTPEGCHIRIWTLPEHAAVELPMEQEQLIA